MDSALQEKLQKKKDLILKEMARKANDEIMVYNPTEKDYPIKWGGMFWMVPNRTKDNGNGKGKEVLLRYLAEKFRKEMVNKLITKENDELMAVEKKNYKGNFWPLHEERIALRTTNPKLRKKYMKVVWLGLHKRFGIDQLPGEATGVPLKPRDRRPLDDILQEEIDNETTDVPEELIQNKPATQKEEFAKAISEEKK